MDDALVSFSTASVIVGAVIDVRLRRFGATIATRGEFSLDRSSSQRLCPSARRQ